MILRLTKKAADYFHIKLVKSEKKAENDLCEWYCNLFIANRRKYFLVVNAITLYSIIFPAKGIKNESGFINSFLSELSDQMISDGFNDIFDNKIKNNCEEVYYYKTESRSVLGSMNDMINMLKYSIEVGDSSEREINDLCNRTPFTSINPNIPKTYIAKYK